MAFNYPLKLRELISPIVLPRLIKYVETSRDLEEINIDVSLPYSTVFVSLNQTSDFFSVVPRESGVRHVAYSDLEGFATDAILYRRYSFFITISFRLRDLLQFSDRGPFFLLWLRRLFLLRYVRNSAPRDRFLLPQKKTHKYTRQTSHPF